MYLFKIYGSEATTYITMHVVFIQQTFQSVFREKMNLKFQETKNEMFTHVHTVIS